MKPRSKKEREFIERADRLRPLSDRQKEWAKGLFPAEALYYSRRGNACEFHCMCCGAVVRRPGKWNLADQVCDWTCPECGAVCKVLPQYNKNAWRSAAPTSGRYVTMMDVHDGIQVFRTFEVCRWNSRSLGEDGVVRGLPTEYHYFEVWQVWLLDSGKDVIVSKSYTRGFNHFTWNHFSEWGIGRHNGHYSGYYVFDDVYDVTGCWFLPGPKITPLLRRNGFSGMLLRINGLDAVAAARRLLTDNTFEEVVKLGYRHVAGYLLNHPSVNVRDYIRSIRICARNGYRIDDPQLWFDYVNDLMFLTLDVHNAHYVCPRNLRQAHTATTLKRRRIEHRRELEEKRKDMAKWEKRYSEAKAPFLGIVFGDERVTISVIQSVHDVYEEGEAMHHCVFTNGYYKHPDSVLLTARDAKGKRLETVEIGLDPFKVCQSRGLQNGRTDYHDAIVSLCKENLDAFREAAQKMTVPIHFTGKYANYYND